eukprot:4571040-Pyramimonas_sp.AAC.2
MSVSTLDPKPVLCCSPALSSYIQLVAPLHPQGVPFLVRKQTERNAPTIFPEACRLQLQAASEPTHRDFMENNSMTRGGHVCGAKVLHIHRQGGTILGTSRGGFSLEKICDAVMYRGVNQCSACTLRCSVVNTCQSVAPQVYVVGGGGAMRGAQTIFEELVTRRKLKEGHMLDSACMCRQRHIRSGWSAQCHQRQAASTCAMVGAVELTLLGGVDITGWS